MRLMNNFFNEKLQNLKKNCVVSKNILRKCQVLF